MMKYFKSNNGRVYAYSREQIQQSERLAELEEIVDSYTDFYKNLLTQLDSKESELAGLNGGDTQKIETIQIEIEKLKEDINYYQKTSDELDSMPPVIYVIRDSISSSHEITDDEIEEHVNPPKTHEQLVGEAESQKSTLLSLASNKIGPLQDAVDLDIATDDELAQLKEWKKYRVLVNRIDTSLAPDIYWPREPECCKGR